MRLNYTHNAVSPVTRNDFINSISRQDAAIVINHELLKEITKEINSQISSKKQGKLFKGMALPVAILSLTNPVGWILSGVTFLSGALLSASDDLKKYMTYAGVDTSDKQIVVFHHKSKVDLSHDTVIYPSYVRTVDYKKTNKKVKL